MRCVMCGRALLRPGTPITVGGVESVIGPKCVVRLRPMQGKQKMRVQLFRRRGHLLDECQIEMFPLPILPASEAKA